MLKKVCFIAPKAYSLFNENIISSFGGAEVQLFLFSKELAKDKDLDINFLVANYKQPIVETYGYIKLWRSFRYGGSIIKQSWDFLMTLHKIKADILIQRSLVKQSALIALYSFFSNKKYIYMVASDRETDGNNTLNKYFLGKCLYYINFHLANKVIVQNKYQKTNLKQNGFNNVTVLKSSYQISNGKREKGKYVLWVGRSHSIKRPYLFLKLARLFPKYKFVMVCVPSPNDKRNFNNLLSKSHEINNLTLIDYVPFSKIDNFFKYALVFVNTSIQEGFPNTFVQAALKSVPILSLSVNPDKFITKYNCGYYCKNSFSSIVKYLNVIISNNTLNYQMGKNAFNYVKREHDLNKNSKILSNILKRL